MSSSTGTHIPGMAARVPERILWNGSPQTDCCKDRVLAEHHHRCHEWTSTESYIHKTLCSPVMCVAILLALSGTDKIQPLISRKVLT